MDDDLGQLVAMGFSEVLARKALKATNNGGLNSAMDWIEQHQDDPEIEKDVDMEGTASPPASSETNGTGKPEEETSTVEVLGEDDAGGPPVAKSMRCDECGKLFATLMEAEWHGSRTKHSKFSESVEEVKPLTEEERKQKMEDAQKKLDELKKVKAEEEKREAKAKELARRKGGKEMGVIKQQYAEKEMKDAAAERKLQRIKDKEAKQKVLDQIKADREARKRESTGEVKAVETAKPTVVAAPPPERNYNECKLQIRLTNGNTLTQTFGADEELSAVRLYIEMNRTDGDAPFRLMTSFPRKFFTDQDMGTPLKALGLVPSAVIIVSRS